MPGQPHPSDIYTYRRPLISSDALDKIAVQLKAIERATLVNGRLIIDPAVRSLVLGTTSPAPSTAAAGFLAESSAEFVHALALPAEPMVEIDGGSDLARLPPTIARRIRAYEENEALLANVEGASALAANLANAQAQARAAGAAVDALLAWNRANVETGRRYYASAVTGYTECQRAALTYFAKRYPTRFPAGYQAPLDPQGIRSDLDGIARQLISSTYATILGQFQARRGLAAADPFEAVRVLHHFDWVRPTEGGVYASAVSLVQALMASDAANAQSKIDVPLLSIALNFTMRSVGDAYRARRKGDDAYRHYEQVWRWRTDLALLNARIEDPSLKLAMGEILLERGDNQYKSGTPVSSPQPDPRYQNLLAAETYQQLLALLQGEQVSLLLALSREAEARLVQLEAGLNWLGYHPNFVPPWRFQYLLERARYFAEQTKGTQRDYLNFLNSAENEEFRERGAEQAVALEESLVKVEAARIEQATSDVAAVGQSKILADLVASNAQRRADNYAKFDESADNLGWVMLGLSAVSAVASLATMAAGAGALFAGAGGLFALLPQDATELGRLGGQAAGVAQVGMQFTQNLLANEQRELEKKNLDLAVGEARRSAAVAQAQLRVAEKAKRVAELQHEVAQLRHTHAKDNLTFLRERVLNAELWYRLVQEMARLSEIHLRRAIEVAFLAEQAYEFEADRRLDVIRFDYGSGDTGGMLAGDYLLADLSRLEHDLITAQQTRQQHVRCVISLARDFPAALQELRENGTTIVSLPLQYLERRFPGLYNLRVGAVDVRPIALLDPTRFSLQLTHLGSSHVRLGPQGGGSAGRTVPSWLPVEVDARWPVELRMTAADTSVFSGLSRAEEREVFSFITTGQRGAFEGLGAAASWRIDMSLRDNRVVPGSLADLLITFDLSGYQAEGLRAAVERAPAGAAALTRYLSARQDFPDASYAFHQSGVLELPVTRDMLAGTERIGRLRNLAVVVTPGNRRVHFDRLMCGYAVEIEVGAGGLRRLSEIPRLTLATNGLTLTAGAAAPPPAPDAPPATLSWNFGDGAGWTTPATATVTHAYQRPGTYRVVLRVVRRQRLVEFTAEVTVSARHQVGQTLTAYPELSLGTGAPAGRTRVAASAQLPSGTMAVWRVIGQPTAQAGAGASFDLPPGIHTLVFAAVRDLKARFYGTQRSASEPPLTMAGLRLSTNLVFDGNGLEVPGQRSELASRLFADGPISPLDAWTLDLTDAGNAFLREVTPQDEARINLGEADILLALEYETVSAFSSQLQAWVEPARVRVGTATSLTVHARDAYTRSPVAGQVFINGVDRAATNATFTYTVTGSEAVTVKAPGYPEADIAIPFLPALRVSAAPAAVVVGRTTAVTVSCRNAATLAPVAGRVFINGVDRAATDFALTYTFTGSEAVRVRVPDYPGEFGVPIAFLPELSVSAAPAQVEIRRSTGLTISCRNASTQAPVAGRVFIDGVDRAATNVKFGYTFAGSEAVRVRVPGYPGEFGVPIAFLPELTVVGPSRVPVGTATSVTVSCRNASTQAPVAGRVFIDGVDRAATNVAFTYTFTGRDAMEVRVPGYPEPAPVSLSYTVSPYTSAAAAAIGGRQL